MAISRKGDCHLPLCRADSGVAPSCLIPTWEVEYKADQLCYLEETTIEMLRSPHL